MLDKFLGGLAGLMFAGCIAALVGALQGSQSPSGGKWLWIATFVFLAFGLVAAVGWWVLRGDEQTEPPLPSQGTVEARSDRGGTAIAAGRDVSIETYHAASPQAVPKERASPSFDLTHQPSSDSFVHLLLSNRADPGEYHVDVIDVQGTAAPQTTPYPVKWRDHAGEDRRVVREALIDLAEVYAPQRRRDDDGLLFISPSRKLSAAWESGYFRLFSFSKQDGWTAEARDQLSPDDVPSEFSFFFEQITVTVRATRIDSGEEIRRMIRLGFEPPKWSEETRQWIVSSAVRIEVDATPEATDG